MKITVANTELVSINAVFPPAPESDPNVNNFEKWLQKESKLSSPDIETMVCFIRVIKQKGRHACFLVLTIPDTQNPDILGDSLALGTTFVWPAKDSTLSKDEIVTRAEADFNRFSKNCKTPDCIFYAASRVVVGYRNGDYKTLTVK